MTEAQFITQFEKIEQELYKKWSRGEKIILIVTKLKDLCEDYIRKFLINYSAKELNGTD